MGVTQLGRISAIDARATQISNAMTHTDLPALDVDAKVDELTASPLGCAFLLIVNESAISADVAATPAVSLRVLADAASETSIWQPLYPRVAEFILSRGRRLRDLARAVLESPASGWWFAPIDRDEQTWAAPYRAPAAAPTPTMFNAPKRPMTRWERRTNKSENGLYTSTLLDGTTAMLSALDSGMASDLMISYPVRSWRLRATNTARVYEMRGPLDWHRLCARYPVQGLLDASDEPGVIQNEKVYPLLRVEGEARYATAIECLLAPDWAAVAADWDGVHMTFGGLLTCDKVRVASAAGWSMNRFWDLEQTLWLRWAFGKPERLPDHESAAHLPVDLGFPHGEMWDATGMLDEANPAIAVYR